MTQEALIAGYVRTPFTTARKGALADVRPDTLSAHVIRALVMQTGIPAETLEDVLWGCAFPEGEQGLNIGRVAGLLGGLPEGVPGATVNRWCGSSMQTVQMAAGQIATGSGDAFIAGGVESMTRVPMMGFNLMPPSVWDAKQVTDFTNMGLTAETVASRYGITREEQDSFAVASQTKALQAQAEGCFAPEIAPFNDTDSDGCVRHTTMDKLATLRTVFLEGGTVTAGTSSPMADGAAAVLVCSPDYAERHGLTPMARITGFAVSGCAPEVMGLGPIESSRKAMARAGVGMDDIDIVEMNEAFAAQSLACIRDLEIDSAKLNIDGGALAIGHPLGATGARLIGKAALLLQREGKRHALATQCIGGGMGIAMVLEAVS
jgi:acetyl-CoA acyltransferase|tara:strand:+ start:40560 stop:41687 length:1128 start_codon:yes stop_codon:yes gene_type:complete